MKLPQEKESDLQMEEIQMREMLIQIIVLFQNS